jgi:hypothetical protein
MPTPIVDVLSVYILDARVLIQFVAPYDLIVLHTCLFVAD